jgi:putative cell wall-binding protein
VRKIFGAAVVALLTVVGAPAAHSTTGASRIFGNDRFLTAIAISQSTYKNNGSASSVVLSRSDDFADALAGTPLAVAKNGPTLLTPTDTLDSPTEAEIKRVLPSGATVYVLGGASAISDAVATQILNDGYTVTRLAGGDRFATAVKIAQTVGTPKTILLARGDDPGDALAAGAAAAKIGGVVVLTDGPNMPSATSDYLSANSQVPVVAVGADAATADP